MYPVGSCYFSTVSTSPATIVGGTWVAMTGGMLGLAGSTGIAEAASNGGSIAISIDQMPYHVHSAQSDSSSAAAWNDYTFTLNRNWNTAAVQRIKVASVSSGWYVMAGNPSASDSAGIEDIGEARYTNGNGGGADFIPAHTSVYGWRRTA